jgi:hypothetical protein
LRKAGLRLIIFSLPHRKPVVPYNPVVSISTYVTDNYFTFIYQSIILFKYRASERNPLGINLTSPGRGHYCRWPLYHQPDVSSEVLMVPGI